MTDAFISYPLQDRDVVRALPDRLAAEHSEVRVNTVWQSL